MENLTLLLLVFTNILIVLILGVFAFFIYRLIREDRKSGSPERPLQSVEQYHPAILERIKDVELKRPKKSDLFCPNHPDEPGETNCAICDHLFCRSCIRPYKSLHFCKEHLPLVMRHDWSEVLTVKTSTTDPEEGVRLYERKRELFEQQDIPTYIETHYKINIDQDYIETYLVVFAIEENLQDIKEKFTDI